jgi:hypothetical protein
MFEYILRIFIYFQSIFKEYVCKVHPSALHVYIGCVYPLVRLL